MLKKLISQFNFLDFVFIRQKNPAKEQIRLISGKCFFTIKNYPRPPLPDEDLDELPEEEDLLGLENEPPELLPLL